MRAAGQPAPAQDGPTATEVGEALLDAARYGDLEDLEQLLKDFGSSHLGYSNQAGVTALHQGAYGLGYLLEGALRLVTPPNPDVVSVCITACANGHAECVSWLIEHGAAFTANESGNTPLREYSCGSSYAGRLF
jgi:ankyrin repeat protein